MGIFMGQKIELLGCIGTTRNLENQSQNPHWAICLPAIGLRVQPLQEIQSDFAKFACVTKMLLVHSNMDGFQILKILLEDLIKDDHIMPKNASTRFKSPRGQRNHKCPHVSQKCPSRTWVVDGPWLGMWAASIHQPSFCSLQLSNSFFYRVSQQSVLRQAASLPIIDLCEVDGFSGLKQLSC